MSGRQYDAWCLDLHPHKAHKFIPFEVGEPSWCLGLPDDPMLQLRANQFDDAQRAVRERGNEAQALARSLYEQRRMEQR